MRLQPSFLSRDNGPLYGVSAILLAAFIALAVLGGPKGSATSRINDQPLGETTTDEPLPATADLPAAADDTVVLSRLSPDEARARNAVIEFAAVGPGNPRPFAFRGSSADRIRARDCLALAGMAEAGGGDGEQRAVMQVILNRVRHPAFSNSVCGVVFEGSQRPTGCQFSFTCDGSLARSYSDSLWDASRQRAEEMLGGATYPLVGNSTHFHADYVYPWWSDELDKVAKVGPHIFFRWRGFWGTVRALSARYRGGEPDPMALRATAVAVAAANPLPTLLESGTAVRSITQEQLAGAPAAGADAEVSRSPGAGVHLVLISPTDAPSELVDRARELCSGEGYCRVQGWTDAANIPAKLPLSEDARRTLRFSFVAGAAGGTEATFFDCRMFAASAAGTCLPNARP